MKCTNCGKEVEADALFCDECGASMAVETAVATENIQETPIVPEQTKVAEQAPKAPEQAEVQKTVAAANAFCITCGTPIPAGSDFCQNCGASQGASAAPQKEKPAKKKAPMGIIIGAVAAVVVLFVVVLGVKALFGGSKGTVDYTFYIKDKEVYYTQAGKKTSAQVTDEFIDGSDVGNSELASAASELGYYFIKSDDGKLMFYPDKMDTYNDNGFNIYFKSTSKLDKEGQKVDSDILAYSVNEAATLVTYIQDDGDLYSYNVKKQEKEKISGNVEQYEVSKDGKTVYFLNDDNVLYCWTQSKGKDKVDSDVTEVCYNTDDFKTIYYLKEGSFYKKTSGKDKEKIASDVSRVFYVYDSGAAYYIKDNSDNQSVADYVYDDKAEEDLNITEPEWPQYPSRYDYSSTTAYDAAVEAYNKEKEAYDGKLQEYYQKLERDYMREQLEGDMEFYLECYELYYYDGKKEEQLSDCFLSRHDYATSEPVIVYSALDMENVEKVELSEFSNIYDLQNEIMDALNENARHYVASGTKVSMIETENGQDFEISSNGDTIMFYSDVDEEKYEGDLYLVEVKNGKLSEPELYDSDVYINSLVVSNSYIRYYKSYEDREADLYIDKKQVDYEVYTQNLSYDSDSNTFYYYVDFDRSKGEGTLKAYKKGKASKIADDVAYYRLVDGNLYYISEYSSKNYKGELYCYNGKKSIKVDEDVVAFLSATSSKSLQGGAYRYGW